MKNDGFIFCCTKFENRENSFSRNFYFSKVSTVMAFEVFLKFPFTLNLVKNS